MNHPTNDELLLLAYGELPESAAAQVEAHVATCPVCRTQFAGLEHARVALDAALPRRRRAYAAWAAVALAAAAVLTGVLIMKSGPFKHEAPRWNPTTTWSATAGYVTGGKAMLDIDAQLTRLERERSYGLPN